MQLKSFEQLKKEYYGEIGTPERDDFEEDALKFRMGVLIQEARKKQGLTQQQLAEKTGMTKGYISRVENDIKDVRLSTLQKIVEGLGGKLNINISL